MTYLSLLHMDPRSRAARRDMADLTSMHRTMMSLFPRAASDSPRNEFAVLWRIEPGDTPTVLLQSACIPDFGSLPDGYASHATQSLDPHLASLVNGGIVYYRTALNPVRSSRMYATNRQIVIPSADRADWWESRARSAGLLLLDKPRLTGRQARRMNRNGAGFPIYSFRADGTARIEDAALLRSAISSGIGRAKAWGCGLLTVARATTGALKIPTLPPRLSRPTLAMLPRVSDQISFVYVDRSRVERDDNGVHAIFRTKERGVERVYLPTASIAALLLGPGTSITQPAAAQTMRDGAVLILSGESGSHFHGAVTHNDLTTKWLHLQAEQWADKNKRTETARRLYRLRFTDDHLTDDKTVDQLRGMEGHRVKNAYRTMSQRYGIPFRRAYNPQDYAASDPVNQALTTANQVLYGVVHSVVAALGASPALGFIHTGGQASFVYDIADLYKLEIAVPAAFSAAKLDDPGPAVRRSMRKNWRMLHLTRRVVADIQHVLDPAGHERIQPTHSEEDGVVRLWSPERGPLEAGVNYAFETPST